MNSAAPIQTQDDAVALQPPLPVWRLHNFIYCQRLFYDQQLNKKGSGVDS